MSKRKQGHLFLSKEAYVDYGQDPNVEDNDRKIERYQKIFPNLNSLSEDDVRDFRKMCSEMLQVRPSNQANSQLKAAGTDLSSYWGASLKDYDFNATQMPDTTDLSALKNLPEFEEVDNIEKYPNLAFAPSPVLIDSGGLYPKELQNPNRGTLAGEGYGDRESANVDINPKLASAVIASTTTVEEGDLDTKTHNPGVGLSDAFMKKYASAVKQVTNSSIVR